MATALPDTEYKRRIRAWSLYDVANSAFATTILAAVLPVYFSSVAGSTLPSETIATAYWSLGLSISLLVVAVLSPILGTISDVMRGKKRFLAIFAGIGIVATSLLVLVSTGDWILAAILAIVGRVGFSGSIVFYDSLLPHVARDDDQDRVSSMGFAWGYAGGGILLAINIAMIQIPAINELFPFAGSRLSFVTVGLWWLLFTIPLLRRVPEPQSATEDLEPGETIISTSIDRLRETLRDIRQYRDLFRYLVAFLIYNDGIGTIIGVAAIYGAELGFGTIDIILVLLLVQFVGIPFSLIFGRIAKPSADNRALFFSFVVFNLILLPIVAVAGRFALPPEISGAAPPPYETTTLSLGQGTYEPAETPLITFEGEWERETIPADVLRPSGIVGFLTNPFSRPQDAVYFVSDAPDAQVDIPFNGQEVEIVYSTGPDRGIWAVEIDGEPLLDDDGQPVTINGYSETVRYGVEQAFSAEEAGEQVLSLVNIPDRDPNAVGNAVAFNSVTVAPPARAEGIPVIGQLLGILIAVNVVSLALAFVVGRAIFRGLVARIDTKGAIMLALVVYTVIAVWGFFLDSTIEFWFLAWMVAMVQGGSQALSRSLYAAMSPASKSGEFFGLFSIMSKFASLLGPLVFAMAGFLLNDSRWGVLSLILFFIVGMILLSGVNVEEGKRVAREEDARLMA